MAYLAVQDFKYGMDRRRPQSSGIPGTLWLLKNAVLTRGGDIERAKKFDAVNSLPAGTFGLGEVAGQLWVFGSASTPSGLPVDVQYQQLAAPSTPTMTKVLDVEAFDSNLYVIAEYDDGSVYHFYDGSRVTDWDTLADAAFDYTSVARRLADKINNDSAVSAQANGAVVRITATTAGTAFTSSTSTTDGSGTASSVPTATKATVQANVAEVDEELATGTIEVTGGSLSASVNRVTSITVDGTELLGEAVDWISSNDATANALVVEINNQASVHGYNASAVGAVVTIEASAGTGATPNGDVVAATTGGDVTVSTANVSGGVTYVAPVAQVETVTIGATSSDATDTWSITIDGTAYKTTGRASAMGLSLLVHKQRMWATAGSLFYYCKLNDPSDWTDTNASSGAGFINMGQQAEGAQQLVGAARYNENVAIFSRTVILIYSLSTDAQENVIVQTIDNTGSMAAQSIVSYGANDVFYLDDTGVRSLRSRDGYNAAYASDVGSAIDTYVQELMDGVTDAELADATAVIEGKDGRYFLAIGQKIVVLSFFPSSKITAWSYLDLEYDIDAIIRSKRDIFIRSGDTIYQYGGATGDVYPDDDEFEVVAETPFLSGKDPAGRKAIQGYDHAAVNTWSVKLLPDPNDTAKTIDLGRLTGTTYNDADAFLPGYPSIYALRYTCDRAGAASLSSTATHYMKGETQ